MSKQYSEKEKGEIFGLRKVGKSIREIGKILDIPYSSVNKIIKKMDLFGQTEHLKQNGRPGNLSPSLASFLKKKIKNNKKLSSRKLAKMVEEEFGERYSHTTIVNFLNKIDLYSFDIIKKPFLKPNHIFNRFEASKRWIKMSEEKVKTMIFSDESKFNLQNSDGRTRIWRTPGTGLKLENVQGTWKFGGGSIMVWGCFSWYGVGPLVFIDTKMDAPYYVNMLSRNLLAYATRVGLSNYVFVQDNDPKHTSRLAKEFFEEQGIEIEPWPAQSPDCNPIENLWGHIKCNIGDKTFKIKPELKEAVKREWYNIPVEMCQKLILSFKKRAMELYRAKGGHIKK